MGTKPSGPGGHLRIEANALGVRKDEQPPTLVAYTFSSKRPAARAERS